MNKISLIFLIVSILVACSKSTIPTSSIQYKVFDATAKSGFEIMKSKCTSCHSFKQPNAFKKERWDKVLPTMFTKAKMTDTAQVNTVKYFIYNNLLTL